MGKDVSGAAFFTHGMGLGKPLINGGGRHSSRQGVETLINSKDEDMKIGKRSNMDGSKYMNKQPHANIGVDGVDSPWVGSLVAVRRLIASTPQRSRSNWRGWR